MSLGGEHLMLFTAIGLPCLSHVLIEVIVHCSAENSNCYQFQTHSPWFWTTEANGRFIADFISCRIWSLVLTFTHKCVYQNIICPGWIKLTFWKVIWKQQIPLNFVQAMEKKKSLILSDVTQILPNKPTCLSLQAPGMETIYHFEHS